MQNGVGQAWKNKAGEESGHLSTAWQGQRTSWTQKLITCTGFTSQTKLIHLFIYRPIFQLPADGQEDLQEMLRHCHKKPCEVMGRSGLTQTLGQSREATQPKAMPELAVGHSTEIDPHNGI